MSRLWMSGFEVYVDSVTNRDGPDGRLSVGTAASRATTGQRSGQAALRVNAAASFADVRFLFTGVIDQWYYARVYLKIVTAPGSTIDILVFNPASGGAPSVKLASNSTVSASQGGSASAALNDGAYHRIEYGVKPSATQASRAWELRVDGATVASGTNQASDSSAAFASLSVGAIQTVTAELFFDDVALNDDQGANQNSWCGDGKVVLLVPTADSAVGTGWTDDNAATTNLWQSVDNTPPAGIADTTSGGGGHQIRNATSNANVNYDATMTTYTAAGIGVSDTINVVTPWVSTAAPIGTGAKAGTVGLVSNPAIASVNLGAGGTAGAFWSGAIAGTYSTGWKATPGTITHAPSVTLGTAPVMRVTQVTASTRIAMVCFMGMYVDYTPAAASPAKRHVQSNQVSIMRPALR